MIRRTFALAIVGTLLLAAGTAFAAGDAKKGEKVFAKCKACHTLEKGQNRVGPSLHGIFGRKSGTAPGFKYSDAMVKAGVVWDEDKIEKYVADPKGFVPGNKMVFVGLKKKDEIEDLLAYLKKEAK